MCNFAVAKQYSATTTALIFEYVALLESYEQAEYFNQKQHGKPLGIASKATRTLYVRPVYGKLLNIEPTNSFCLVQETNARLSRDQSA